jgi:DNA-binding NarL/FixJ family response regulator
VPTIRVVIADGHPFYRHGLAKLLTASGIEVVGEAANGWAAIKAVEKASPDVLVLDLSLPGLDGPEVLRLLTRRSPPTPVLVLSSSADEADVSAAIGNGADGYVLKDGPVKEVVAGIRAVAAGWSLVSPRVGSVVLRKVREQPEPGRDPDTGRRLPPVPLSQRERDVLRMMADGLSNEKIGEGLSIGAGTARNYVSRLLTKLEAENRVQAAVRAVRDGMV